MVDGPEGAVTLRSLIENEIPDGRASLESSCSNLERVAAYCEANYAQVLLHNLKLIFIRVKKVLDSMSWIRLLLHHIRWYFGKLVLIS